MANEREEQDAQGLPKCRVWSSWSRGGGKVIGTASHLEPPSHEGLVGLTMAMMLMMMVMMTTIIIFTRPQTEQSKKR